MSIFFFAPSEYANASLLKPFRGLSSRAIYGCNPRRIRGKNTTANNETSEGRKGVEGEFEARIVLINKKEKEKRLYGIGQLSTIFHFHSITLRWY